MQKYILISILFINNTNYSQVVDTTKWNAKYIDSLGISFEYPSYFELDNFDYGDTQPGEIIFAQLVYEYYVEYGKASEYMNDPDTTRLLYIDYPTSLALLITDKSIEEIGRENEYTVKDSLWYDTKMLEDGWSDEPAKEYKFEKWKGYISTTPARIYFAGGGGCLTAAGEEQRIILMKRINADKKIFAIASGFDFPEGGTILQMICKSISIK
jgi:hypothetical protein